jgi:putative phosphoesterase
VPTPRRSSSASRHPYPPAILRAHPRHVLELRDGALRLALVADTHGRPHPRSEALVSAERPDHILHAGDIGDLGALDGFASIAPLTAVRGNIDEGWGSASATAYAGAASIGDAATIDVREGDVSRLRILMVHIGLAGTRLRADVARLARAEGASIVVCGHSHVPFIGRHDELVAMNPGSIGPRRFQLPILFGVIAISAGGIDLYHVDCDAGARWSP